MHVDHVVTADRRLAAILALLVAIGYGLLAGWSGHRPLWEQPTQFHDLMADVLVDTAPTR